MFIVLPPGNYWKPRNPDSGFGNDYSTETVVFEEYNYHHTYLLGLPRTEAKMGSKGGYHAKFPGVGTPCLLDITQFPHQSMSLCIFSVFDEI